MSTTQLMIAGADGVMYDGAERQNSHGGVAMVWNSLVHYLPKQDYPGIRWEQVWAWAKENPDGLEHWERLVLYFTYDDALVPKELLEELAEALDTFEDVYGRGGYACHLSTWAEEIRALPDDVLAVGLHATSVNENPWHWHDDKLEVMVRYNINTMDKHWFIQRKGEPEAEGDDEAEPLSEDDQQYQDSLAPCVCGKPPHFEHSSAAYLDDGDPGDVWSIWHVCDNANGQEIHGGHYETADEARDVWSKMVRPKQGDTAQLLARAKEVDDLHARVQEFEFWAERLADSVDSSCEFCMRVRNELLNLLAEPQVLDAPEKIQ